MAKYRADLEYNIKTKLDNSGITQLQQSLQKLSNTLSSSLKSKDISTDTNAIKRMRTEVNQLQSAITRAFNPKIGTLDLQKFNNILKSENITIKELSKNMSRFGADGKAAINSLASAMTIYQKKAISANTALSKMATTMANTMRWGVTATVWQEMLSSVSGAINYMRDLDESLTQIQMVSQSSASSMRDLAKYANQAAKGLATTTVDYTNAIKVFTQEGFSLPESKQQAELSIKLANVSEQDSATTADQLTAYRNAFGLTIDQAATSLDKLASVANNTASNVGELMTAAQKSASVAASVGASEDSFIASIATIQSVTRQSADEIGNGLKSMMQRFADIKSGESTEDGVDYGQYAQAMKSAGVDVLDASGNYKGFDQIIEELQAAWTNLTDTQKIAVGEKVAGKYQYNRFAALMNNPEYYQTAYDATQNANGAMDRMQEVYADSIEGRLKTLQAAGEQLITTLFDQDAVEPVLEKVTSLVELLNRLVELAGGAQGVFTALAAVMTRAFSPQIGQGISNLIQGVSISNQIRNSNKNVQAAFNILGINKDPNLTTYTSQYAQSIMPFYKNASTEDRARISNYTKSLGDTENKKYYLQESMQKTRKEVYDAATSNFLKQALNAKIEDAKEEVTEKKSAKNIANDNAARAKDQLRNSRDEDIRVKQKKILQMNEAVQQQASASQDLKNAEEKVNSYKQQKIQLNEIVDKINQGIELDEKDLNFLKRKNSLLEEEGISLKQLIEDYQKMGLQQEQIEQQLKSEITQARQLKQELIHQQVGSGVSDIASSMTSAVFAYQSLNSIMETLGDETLSSKEKFDSLLMSITMLGMSGVPAIQSLVSGIGKIKSSLQGISALELEDTILSAIQGGTGDAKTKTLGTTFASTYSNMSKKDKQEFQNAMNIINSRNPSTTEAERTAAHGTLNRLGLDAAAVGLEGTEAQRVQTNIGNQVLAADTRSQQRSAAIKQIGTSVKSLDFKGIAQGASAFFSTLSAGTKILLKFAGVATLVAGAIAGIAFVAKGIYEDYNKDALAAQKAADTASELAEQYNSAKEAYTNLQQDFSSYQDAREALGKLEEGTQDWKDQLAEVNSQVLDLLDKYPQLAEYVSTASTGEMIISSTGLDLFKEQINSQKKAAQFSSITAQIDARDANVKKDKTDLARKIRYAPSQEIEDDRSVSENIFDAFSSAGFREGSAAQNQIAGNLSLLGQKELSKKYSSEADKNSNAAETKQISQTDLDKVISNAIEKGYTNVKDLSDSEKVKDIVTDPAQVDAITSNADQISSFIQEQTNANNENSAAIQAICNSILTEVSGKSPTEGMSSIAANMYEKERTAVAEKWEGKTLNDQDLVDEYLKANGWDKQNVDIDTSDGKIKISNLNGKALNGEGLSAEGVINNIASIAAMNKVTESTGTIEQEAKEVSESTGASDAGSNGEAAILSGKKDEEGNVTFSGINELTKSGARRQQEAMKEMSSEDRAQYLGVSSDVATNAGFQSKEEYVDQYFEKIKEKNESPDWKQELNQRDIRDEGRGPYVANWNQIKDNDKTVVDNVESISELNDIYEKGQTTVNGYSDSLEKLGDQYPDLKKEVSEVADAQEEYNKAERGNDPTKQTEALKKLIKAQQKLEKSLVVKEWNKANDNIKKYGKTLLDAEEGTDEFNKAATALIDIFKDMLGQDIPDDFFNMESNRKLLQDYIDGVEGAGSKLRVAMGQSTADAAQAINSINEAYTSATGSVVDIGTAAQAAINNLSFDINGNADFSNVINALGLLDSEMEVTEAMAMAVGQQLASVGATEINFDFNGEGDPIDVDVQALKSGDLEAVANFINAIQNMRAGIRTNSNVVVPAGANPIMTSSPGSNSSDGGGGGGGGGGSSKPAKAKEKDKGKWDVFKPIENKLDRLNAKQEKLSEYDNELYGTKQINNLKKLISTYEEYIKLKQEELDIAQQQIDLQKYQTEDDYGNTTLRGFADKIGIALQYDVDGNVANGEEIYKAFVQAYNDAVDTYNEHKDDEDTTEYDDAVSDAKQDMDDFKTAFDDYHELLSKREEYEKDIRDAVDDIQDTNDKIIDELHSMLEEWMSLSKELRDFNKEIGEFLNGADLTKKFKPAIESATSSLKDLISVSGTKTDQKGNVTSFSGLSEQEAKDLLKGKNAIPEDVIFDNELDKAGANEIYQRLMPREDANSSWKYIWDTYFDKGTLREMVDHMRAGDQDAAQKLYNEAYQSIMYANPDRDLVERLKDRDTYNSFVDAVIKAANATSEQVGSKYTSVAYSSPYLAALTQLQDAMANLDDSINNEDSKINQQQAIDNLKDAMDSAKSIAEDVIDAFDSLDEVISDAIDAASDIISKRLDKYDNLEDALSNITDQISLFYGESGYDYQLKASDATIGVYNGKLDTIETGINYWQSIVDELEDTKQKNVHWSEANQEALDNAKDQITDLQQQQMDTEQSLLEQIASRIETQANKAANEFANNLLGGDIDWMQEQWAMRQRNEELYLDDMNRAYNIQKLQYQYQKMINDATEKNTGLQEQISAQMNDQLEYLQNKEKLTQSDLDYANAQLDILQKQIALQDAQSSKTTMQLQRDASGNYSYVYTANESDVAQKQQDLIDSQINAYNIAKNALLESENNTITEIASARDKIIEIWTDANLDAEERKARISEVMDSLGEYTQGQSENVKTYALEMLQQVAASVDQISEENAGGLDDIFTKLNNYSTDALNTIDDRFTLFSEHTGLTLGDVKDSMVAMMKEIEENSETNLNNFDEYADKLKQDAAQSFQEYSTNIVGALSRIYSGISEGTSVGAATVSALDMALAKLSDDANNLSINMPSFEADLSSTESTIIEVCGNITGSVAKMVNEVFDQIQKSYTEASKALQKVNSDLSSVTITAGKAGQAVGNLNKYTGSIEDNKWVTGQISNQDISYDPNTGKYSVLLDGKKYSKTEWAEGIAGSIVVGNGSWKNYSYYGNEDEYDKKLKDGVSSWYAGDEEFVEMVRKYIQQMQAGSIAHDQQYYSQFMRFDTGGYTGDWSGGVDNKGGRMAILHQKEIVLNKDDTANLLEAIGQVRALQESGINQMFAKSNYGFKSQGDTIEQRVEITADFPAVTSSIEIERALSNLADAAYQSAHRNY